MHILEISFHTCHFIDISASFTPHSDSEPCFISEPLLMIFLIEKIHCTVAITTMYFTAEWSIESLKTPPYFQRLTIDFDDFTSFYLMNT